jgi:uncharacterized protein (TIGR03083 family)
MSLEFDTYLTLIDTEAQAFDETLEGIPTDRSVPGCPGWTVADLREHTAGVFAFWLHQLADTAPDAEQPTFPSTARARAAEPVHTLARETIDILAERGPTSPCWNWSGTNRSIAWVVRRLANEVSVHRADAAAAAGDQPLIPAELAADGIDELIEVFLDAPPGSRYGNPPLLRLDTPERRWSIRVSEDGVWPDGAGDGVDDGVGGGGDDGGEAPTVVTGSASDVLLRLWGRPSAAAVSGDPRAIARWSSLAAFD